LGALYYIVPSLYIRSYLLPHLCLELLLSTVIIDDMKIFIVFTAIFTAIITAIITNFLNESGYNLLNSEYAIEWKINEAIKVNNKIELKNLTGIIGFNE
jgi:hypothetical protein